MTTGSAEERMATTNARERRAVHGGGPSLEGMARRSLSPSERGRMVRLAYRFLWNHEEAEDVVQDALIVAWEHADELRDPDRWWVWLSRIVVQRCQQQRRKRTRWRKYLAAFRTREPVQSPENETLVLSPAIEKVRAVLQTLPRRQYEVVVLRHLEEMSYEDIGAMLEISPATARVHARSARESLRSELLRACPGWFERREKTPEDKP